MKKITILCMAFLGGMTVQAQQTFEIDNWQQGITQEDASFVIDQGDTVLWTWANGVPHSVTSQAGSAEAFDSGIITGTGSEFSYTFNVVGSNSYICIVHPAMAGVITVEEVLGVQDKFERNVKFVPNPAKNELIIGSLFSLDTYEIYNMSGKKVSWGNGDGTFTSLNVSHLPAGVYFVKVTSDDLQATIKLIKE